jgi:type IV pilus assembly protein PilC
MADYYERDRIMKEKIRGAILYPSTLFVMMSVIVVLLVPEVLPMFERIFNQIGGHISSTANAALSFGMTAGAIALGLIIVCAVVALLTFLISRTRGGKYVMNSLYMKLPVIKGFMSKIAARNFASAMSMMLFSGVDIDKSLEMSSAVLNNSFLSKKLDACREKVRQGVAFTDAISQAGLFPGLFSRMLGIGFKTGATSDVMDKLSKIYEDEIGASLDNATALIEPILVGILALIIGIILVAVMLPLAGIMTSIG